MTTATAPCPPLEDLAAYADGRLDAAERARVTEHLASCERCYALFLGVADALEEEEAAAAAADPPRGRPGAWPWRAAAAAATLAAAAGIAWAVVALWPSSPPAFASADLVASVDAPAGELAGHLWESVRYRGAPAEDLDRQPQAFYVGVLLVDLRVALEADDAKRAEEVLGQIVVTLTGVEFIDPEIDFYTRARDEIGKDRTPAALLAPAAERERSLGDRFSEVYLPFGKWAEAARLAAATGDAGYLESRRSRRFLAWLLTQKDEEVEADVRKELAALRSDLAAPGGTGATAAAKRLATIIRTYETEAHQGIY
jgi:Putative zinc-finger